jgi:hypothetical protein
LKKSESISFTGGSGSITTFGATRYLLSLRCVGKLIAFYVCF